MSAPNPFVLDPKLVFIIETSTKSPLLVQCGRSWQPFGEGKMGMRIFVRHVFAIFVTFALLLRVLANLQIQFL